MRNYASEAVLIISTRLCIESSFQLSYAIRFFRFIVPISVVSRLEENVAESSVHNADFINA